MSKRVFGIVLVVALKSYLETFKVVGSVCVLFKWPDVCALVWFALKEPLNRLASG